MYYHRDHCKASCKLIIYYYWQNIALCISKGLSKLVSWQYNNHKSKIHFCQYCLHAWISKEVLKDHLGRCKLHGAQRIKLSETEEKKGRCKIKFTITEYQLHLPFVIYADFESVLHKQASYEPLSSKSFTNQYQQPCGTCIFIKLSGERYFDVPQVNIGDDAAEKFLDQALAAATICRQHLTNKITMKRLTQEQWREYNNATNSFMSADKKVRDHDHLTGECRGPAHNIRNLN